MPPPPPPTATTTAAGRRRRRCASRCRHEPLPTDVVAGRSLDDLNRDSPLQPIFFEYDSADVNDAGRAILQANAAVLKKYSSWVITIEGHCDERGTADTIWLWANGARSRRGTISSRSGIDANRLRTVSYGSEFPFDPAHQETRVEPQPPRALCDYRKMSRKRRDQDRA